MSKVEDMSMSFSGCGFLGLYYAGVAVCFKRYASHIRFNNISGASAGAIAACSLLCDMPAEAYINDMLDLVKEARNRTLGPFSPSFNLSKVMREKLWNILPKDVHVQVRGRLRVSLTRVCDGKNVIISDFDSKEELIDCLLASSFVPVFSGLVPPKFRGVRYIDGMFTDNLPRLTEDTITVSPFCGESDICPQYDSTPLFHINFSNTSIALSFRNIVNFATIIWPPSSEVIAQFCKQGLEDALRFLQQNGHISCKTCLSIQAIYAISEEEDKEMIEYDPQCEKCEETRQEANVAGLPANIESLLQNYIDSANKGFYNWLLNHRGVKIISVLTLPYTLPFDCAYAFILMVKNIMPHMIVNLQGMYKFLMEELVTILNNVSSKAGYKLSATLRMEYAEGGEFRQGSDKQIKLDFHVDDKILDVVKLKSTGVLSRRGSLALSTSGDCDTYENILEVTSRHESILAFYYTDDNNKLRVTEIFDVTDCPEEHNCGVVKKDDETSKDLTAVDDSENPLQPSFPESSFDSPSDYVGSDSPIVSEDDTIINTEENSSIVKLECEESQKLSAI
uniref:triacylglycerol lipase n=1 Tax=Lygus hesperus TaxID=30085 RepID=A0A146LPE6_LYGHE